MPRLQIHESKPGWLLLVAERSFCVRFGGAEMRRLVVFGDEVVPVVDFAGEDAFLVREGFERLLGKGVGGSSASQMHVVEDGVQERTIESKPTVKTIILRSVFAVAALISSCEAIADSQGKTTC